jgi:hypothetical protein
MECGMTGHGLRMVAVAALMGLAGTAQAAQCGNTPVTLSSDEPYLGRITELWRR